MAIATLSGGILSLPCLKQIEIASIHLNYALLLPKKASPSLRELAKGVNAFVLRYNTIRPHQSLEGKTPTEVYEKEKAKAA